MLPSIEIRINNLIKSLEKTIIPAVNPDDSLALEQAALVVGHLQVLSQQWDGAYIFERGSLFQLKALALLLLAAATGEGFNMPAVTQLQEAVDDIPEVLPLTVTGINPYIQALGEGVDALINASFNDASEALNREVSAYVLAYGQRQALRERSWFQGNGLDTDKQELMPIDELLKTDLAFEHTGK